MLSSKLMQNAYHSVIRMIMGVPKKKDRGKINLILVEKEPYKLLPSENSPESPLRTIIDSIRKTSFRKAETIETYEAVSFDQVRSHSTWSSAKTLVDVPNRNSQATVSSSQNEGNESEKSIPILEKIVPDFKKAILEKRQVENKALKKNLLSKNKRSIGGIRQRGLGSVSMAKQALLISDDKIDDSFLDLLKSLSKYAVTNNLSPLNDAQLRVLVGSCAHDISGTYAETQQRHEEALQSQAYRKYAKTGELTAKWKKVADDIAGKSRKHIFPFIQKALEAENPQALKHAFDTTLLHKNDLKRAS